jgi:hypothetical protein
VSGVESEGGKPGVAAACCTNRAATFLPSKGKPDQQAGERFPDIHCGQRGVPGSLRDLHRQDRCGGSESCPGHNPHDQHEKSKKPLLIGETKNQFIKGTPTHDWLITFVNACSEPSLFKADLPDEPLPGFASTYV